jgi:hypothetical protein
MVGNELHQRQQGDQQNSKNYKHMGLNEPWMTAPGDDGRGHGDGDDPVRRSAIDAIPATAIMPTAPAEAVKHPLRRIDLVRQEQPSRLPGTPRERYRCLGPVEQLQVAVAR